MVEFKDISFGVTSAVITSLAVIVGLSGTINARINILIALLIIAIADNVSDSFGIHIYQEAQCESPGEVKKTTFDNFIARLIITSIFVLLIILVPLNIAIIFSIIIGLSLLIILSYYISKKQKVNPYASILKHLTIAIVVMVASFLLRELISNYVVKFFK